MEVQIRILLADSDVDILGLESDYLQVRDCQVVAVSSAAEVLSEMQQRLPMVCVLSSNLQDMPVVELVQQIRKRGFVIPVMVYGDVAAREEMLSIYRAGVDAFLPKPFPVEVLLLQVQSLQRLYSIGLPVREGCYDFGNVYFDANAHQVGEVSLSTMESNILDLLCQHRNEVVRSSLMRDLFWHSRGANSDRRLPIYIHRLRQALKCAPAMAIVSVHGVGYKLVDLEA